MTDGIPHPFEIFYSAEESGYFIFVPDGCVLVNGVAATNDDVDNGNLALDFGETLPQKVYCHVSKKEAEEGSEEEGGWEFTIDGEAEKEGAKYNVLVATFGQSENDGQSYDVVCSAISFGGDGATLYGDAENSEPTDGRDLGKGDNSDIILIQGQHVKDEDSDDLRPVSGLQVRTGPAGDESGGNPFVVLDVIGRKDKCEHDGQAQKSWGAKELKVKNGSTIVKTVHFLGCDDVEIDVRSGGGGGGGGGGDWPDPDPDDPTPDPPDEPLDKTTYVRTITGDTEDSEYLSGDVHLVGALGSGLSVDTTRRRFPTEDYPNTDGFATIDIDGREEDDEFGVRTITVKGETEEDDTTAKFFGTEDIEIPHGGAGGDGVDSLNKLKDDIDIIGGSGISVTKKGQTIQIGYQEGKEPDEDPNAEKPSQCDHPGNTSAEDEEEKSGGGGGGGGGVHVEEEEKDNQGGTGCCGSGTTGGGGSGQSSPESGSPGKKVEDVPGGKPADGKQTDGAPSGGSDGQSSSSKGKEIDSGAVEPSASSKKSSNDKTSHDNLGKNKKSKLTMNTSPFAKDPNWKGGIGNAGREKTPIYKNSHTQLTQNGKKPIADSKGFSTSPWAKDPNWKGGIGVR